MCACAFTTGHSASGRISKPLYRPRLEVALVWILIGVEEARRGDETSLAGVRRRAAAIS